MARLSDTDRAAEALQIDLLRAAGPGRRLSLALSLTETVFELARSAIRRSMPEASEEEVRLRFVEVHYGADLARDVRAYIERHRRSREAHGG